MAKLQTPSNDQDFTPVTVLMSPDVPLGSFLASFDHTKEENTHKLFHASQPTDIQASDSVGEVFPMSDWCCVAMEIDNREGTGKDRVVRTVLMSADGRTMGTMSSGILRSIDLIRKTFGDGPYPRPVNLVVKTADVGQAGDMLFLYPADAADSGVKPTK